MLVLTRKKSEAVLVIGPNEEELLRVEVVEIRGDKVRLGFEFTTPKYREYNVHRQEVWEAMKRDRAKEEEKNRPQGESAS